MWVEQSCHPALGLQTTGPKGQGQSPSLRFPIPFCLPVSCFFPRAAQPAPPCILLQLVPNASMPVLLSLGGGGTRVGS